MHGWGGRGNCTKTAFTSERASVCNLWPVTPGTEGDVLRFCYNWRCMGVFRMEKKKCEKEKTMCKHIKQISYKSCLTGCQRCDLKPYLTVEMLLCISFTLRNKRTKLALL